jgi:anaerobic ribonucleoside-triphosphate reductase activating protein
MLLRIHRFLPITNAEGPGKRACIWVQGCPIQCCGCAVPETWSFNGGRQIDVQEIVERISDIPQIEGVTFVGGEPFMQAKELSYIGRKIQERGLSVLTFTGFVIDEIKKKKIKDWYDLLSVTDLLIDGPYRYDLADVSRPWVGSSNQNYHFLSQRYKYLEAEINNLSNRLEIRLYPNGQIDVNGMASSEMLKDIFNQAVIINNVAP